MTIMDLSLHRSDPRATMSSLFVCRISGLPFDALVAPGGEALMLLVDRILEIESILQRTRDDLSFRLHEQIGQIVDQKVRRAAIDVRRSLFNMRVVPPSTIAAIEHAVPERLVDETQTAARLIEERLLLTRQCLSAHHDVLGSAREVFRHALLDDDYLKGLVLSTDTLFGNVHKYRAGTSSGSRREQIERGLLRYFTRMSAKATPFGRFCAVIGGEMIEADSSAPLLAFAGNPLVKRSIVRLNKRIYARVWSRLMALPAVRNVLRAELNPTLQVTAGTLTFMMAKGSQEIFQHLQTAEVLNVIIEVVESADGITLSQLISRLRTDPRCEATEDEAVSFCEKLIEIGFLRLLAVVPEQEPNWLPLIIDFLRNIDDDSVREVLPILVLLGELKTEYENGSANERAAVLQRMRAVIKDLVPVGESAPVPRESPVFEDATAEATLQISVTPALNRVFEVLGKYIRVTMPLAGSQREMATMRHFVDEHYGIRSQLDGIPLLEFYEAFYREHFKGHLERTQKNAANRESPGEQYNPQNPFDLDRIKAINNAARLLSERVQSLWMANPGAEEIDVSEEALDECLGDVGASFDARLRSVGLFSQLVATDHGPRLVLQQGRYFAGFGKYFSRFLYLLPDRWLQAVQNENLAEDKVILAEICSDAAFNANLHPSLVTREIAYPTGQHAPSAQVLKSADLRVFADAEDPHALVLRDNTSRARVWPLDLGFLNPMMRPPLFQLLSRFSPAGFFGFPVPSHIGKRSSSDQVGNVVCRPRLVLAGCVVLARRSWTVPQSQFPAVAPGENDASHFLRIQTWRRKHGVPDIAYVRVNVSSKPTASPAKPGEAHGDVASDDAYPHVEDGSEPVESMATASQPTSQEAGENKKTPGPQSVPRHSRDYAKPQFIDFTNPLLVRLFARIASGLSQFTLTIEECLPGPTQLPKHDGKPYATELIMQVRFSEDA